MHKNSVNLSVDDRGVAHICLNRPQKHNAINEQMLDDITKFCQTLPLHTRLVLITATGKNFCAGADLQWMQQQFTATRTQRLQQSAKLANMLQLLDQLAVPVISMVQGAVYGGGLGILAVSDRVVATRDTQFCFSEVLLGLIPATIGPFVYAKAGNALRACFLTAQPFDVTLAQRLNLVTDIVAASELQQAMTTNIDQALKCDGAAAARAKTLLRTFGTTGSTDNFHQHSIEALADCWQQPTTMQRIASFLERKQSVKGRESGQE